MYKERSGGDLCDKVNFVDDPLKKKVNRCVIYVLHFMSSVQNVMIALFLVVDKLFSYDSSFCST